MSKICTIFHDCDLDGWMSAAIVKHWFNQQEVPNKEGEDCNTIDFIGYNYGQPIPDLSEYDRVIMCDISFPRETMVNLLNRLDINLIWIDHHISAIKDIVGMHNALQENGTDISTAFNGLRDTKFAACELTWKYFFPDKPMPEIVRLLGRYDCFGHKGTDEEQKVLEFQYGARACMNDYNSCYGYLTKSLVDESTNDMILYEGRSIYNYLCTEAKQVYKNGFEIGLIGPIKNLPIGTGTYIPTRKFICINKERFNPINFGIDYHADGYDGAACFHYDGVAKLWKFSLYNDNGKVDCSQIAKQFGGGGHKGAAGFVISDLTLIFK